MMTNRDRKTVRRNELLNRYQNKHKNNNRYVVNDVNDKYLTDNEKKIIDKKSSSNKTIGIIISSYNRYDKLINIIENILLSNLIENIDIIILDDCSTDERYSNLNEKYNEIILLKNNKNNGKHEYWKSINKLFAVCKEKKYDYVIQIDDDFELCDSFVEKILDVFDDQKYCCFHYHYNGKEDGRWGLNNWIDGGVLFSKSFLEKINYNINPINSNRWKINKNISSGVWEQISKKINNMGLKILKTNVSYVEHNGNFDSKMNYDVRKNTPIYTKNYIDNK